MKNIFCEHLINKIHVVGLCFLLFFNCANQLWHACMKPKLWNTH